MKEKDDWNQKEEVDKEVQEKAAADAQRRQLKVSPHLSCTFWRLTLFQMLKKQKEAHKAWWVVVGEVSTGGFSSRDQK